MPRILPALAVIGGLTVPAAAQGPVYHPSATAVARDLPFSDAVQMGDILFLSGKIGTDPDTNELVAGGIGPETRRTMDNIGLALAKHGLDHGDILKCTVFLADIAEYGAMNAVYRSYFETGRYPARSALAASGLALGSRVEIECIAALRR